MTKLVLRQAHSVTANIRAFTIENAHSESFNALNLALDIRDGGHGN